MELRGEAILHARIEPIWSALHDTEQLKHCIRGCETLEWLDEETLKASLALRVAGMKYRLASRVHIRDQVPMEGYTLLFGRHAENASVSSIVRLSAHEEGTKIAYEVEARLDNALARLGAGVMERFARKMATRFFKCLDKSLADSPY